METGVPREEIRKLQYHDDRNGRLLTGDIRLQRRESYLYEQERNFKMAIVLALITGVGFLFSLFGMWK